MRADLALAPNVTHVAIHGERERPEKLYWPVGGDFQLDVRDDLLGRNSEVERLPYLRHEAFRENRGREVELRSWDQTDGHEPPALPLTDCIVQPVPFQHSCKTQARVPCESGKLVFAIGVDAESAFNESLPPCDVTINEENEGWGCFPDEAGPLEDRRPGVGIRLDRSIIGHKSGARGLWSYHYVCWEVEGHAAFNSQR